MESNQNPAKEFLNRYRHLVQRRESLLREIDMIRARATSTSVRIKDVNVLSSSRIHDQMAEDAALLADSTAALDALVKEIDLALREILEAIAAVDDEKQKTVLTLRYIEGLSWQHVQERMAYEHTQVMVIHGRALLKVKEWIKERTKTDICL
jgi:DNA-directed RNA polymerase specialized sigma24 family protein